MAEEKKIICGGFLVGEGLDIDGKTLYATGGSEEPVEVTFENPTIAYFGNLVYDVVGYEEGKPIKFWTGYYWNTMTLNCLGVDDDNEYFYSVPSEFLTLKISKKYGGGYEITQYWNQIRYTYDKDTGEVRLEDFLNSDGNPYIIASNQPIQEGLFSTVFIEHETAGKVYMLHCVGSGSGFTATVCDNNGNNPRNIFFRKQGSTITYKVTSLATT